LAIPAVNVTAYAGSTDDKKRERMRNKDMKFLVAALLEE